MSNVYIAQAKNGQWVSTQINTQEGAGFIQTDLETIRVQNADVVLVPNPKPGKPKGAVAIANINGIAQFLEQNQRIKFELTGQPKTGGKLAIAGETHPATLQQTTVNIQAQNLLAADLSRLINLPINLQSGRVDGDIKVQLQPQGQQPAVFGTASLKNVTARIANIPQLFTNTQGKLQFQGQKIALENVNTRYGKIPVQISGAVNTQTGYNLSGQVKAVSVNNVLNTLKVDFPVSTTGTLTANLQVQGAIRQPILTGKVSTIKTAQIDRVKFNNINSRFRLTTAGSTPKITFTNIQATPTVGGKITGSGQIQLGTQPQIAFNFRAPNLPGNALAQTYNISTPIQVGDILAVAKISGTPGNIRTVAQISVPEATYPGKAEVVVTNAGNVLLRNAVFNVADGTIKATGQINQKRQFQAVVDATGIALNQFSPQLRGRLRANNLQISGDSFQLADIQAQGQVRFSQGLAIVKQPLTAQVRWNGQQIIVQKATAPGLTAQGTVAVQLPENAAPQIAGLNLDVQARGYNLQNFGLNLPGNIALAGQADFTGQVTGTPTALGAVGDLRLRNLSVNNLAFDLVLAGRLNYQPGERTQLEVAGQQDRIAFTLNDNNRPISFFVERDQAVAIGRTQGENLVVNVSDFPVAVLRSVIPGNRLQNLGAIAGDISANLVIDLAENLTESTLVGDVAISQPRVRSFAADVLQGRIRYEDGALTLREGELRQGETSISLSGNLEGGGDRQFQFQINFDRAKIENVLPTLGIFDLQDITGGTPPVLTGAETLQTVSVGLPESSLLTQLRRFSEIKALLEQQRQQQQASPLPPLAALNGTISGNIEVSGSLQPGTQPAFNVSFNLLGQDWVWENFTTIDEVVAQGTYNNGVLTLLPLRLDLGEGAIAFTGQLAQEELSGQVRVTTLPLSLIKPFLPPQFPLEVAGRLNTLVTVAGSLENPRAIGEVALVEGSVNEQPVESAQLSFSYNDARLNFGSTVLIAQRQPVEITGSIPLALPFAAVQPQSDRISLQANVQDEGLALLNLFTDRVTWVKGQGQLNVQVQGTLNQPVVMGKAVVENATFKAQALPEALTNVTGTVQFNGDRIIVPSIQAQYNRELVTASGILPIFATPQTQQQATNNPLTISLNDLNVDLAGLYQGGASGNVVITGTALSPNLGGTIRLSNGKILVGGTEAAATSKPANTTTANATPSTQLPIDLTDLRLVLGEDVRVTRQPIFSFEAEGDLTVNGNLANPRPQGVVRLVGGQVNLFTTVFTLARSEAQTARFTPKGGLDPILDVTLVATVPEATGEFSVPTSPLSSEIRDPSTTSFATFRTVRVEASIQGAASELAENLELTSDPNRSESEIVALLGGSFVNNFGRGDPTLGLAAIASSTLLNNLQGSIAKIGEAIGIDELRLFPTIVTDPTEDVSVLGLTAEAIFDITDDFSISLSRVFATDEPFRYNLLYRLNDQTLVRGSTDLSGESRVLVEYQTRF